MGADPSSSVNGGRFGRLRHDFHRLRSLLGGRKVLVIALSAAAAGAGLTEAGVLVLVSKIAAEMVVGGRAFTAAFGPMEVDLSLGTALVAALALAALRFGFQLLLAWLPARLSADVLGQLRRELFGAFSRSSWQVQAEEREGHLQELMTNQASQATLGALNVAIALSSGAMFAVLVASAFVLSGLVALMLLLTAAGLFALLRPLGRWGRGSARELSQVEMDQAATVSESVRMAEDAQVFGTAAAHRIRVDELIALSSRTFFRFQLSLRLASGMYQSLTILLIVGGLAGLYATGAGELAALGAVLLMLVRAASYGQALQGAVHALNQTMPYLDRLATAIRRYGLSGPADGARSLATIATIAFDGVSFGYQPGRPVLRQVDFEVRAGETIGIVGPSGAGKSTIVQLLLRLREPDDGLYLVNGNPAAEFSREDWQKYVAYLPQEPRVFHGSVADNIRYFRDLDDAAVERAARLAHVHDDISGLKAGYETVIGQRADAVSGGQCQRICLARALAAQPQMLVLDEPTSALDLASEAAIQTTLADLRGRVTLFIVAHRLSTLNHCDRILVLVDGSVQAFAPATELERTNSFYREATMLTIRPVR